MTYAPSGARRNVTNWFATEVPKIGLSITNSVSKLSVHDHCACLYYPSLHLALFLSKTYFLQNYYVQDVQCAYMYIILCIVDVILTRTNYFEI